MKYLFMILVFGFPCQAKSKSETDELKRVKREFAEEIEELVQGKKNEVVVVEIDIDSVETPPAPTKENQ